MPWYWKIHLTRTTTRPYTFALGLLSGALLASALFAGLIVHYGRKG